jgi:hypothetical protein
LCRFASPDAGIGVFDYVGVEIEVGYFEQRGVMARPRGLLAAFGSSSQAPPFFPFASSLQVEPLTSASGGLWLYKNSMKKSNKNNGLKFKRSFCTPAVLHGAKKKLIQKVDFLYSYG